MIMYRVVDLFCGAGGFSRGFELEGFEIVCGLDNFTPAARTFRENFPGAIVIEEDIKLVHSLEILKCIGEDIDVIIGSPPCEPFTPTNPRRMKTPLDRLYKDPLGILTLHFIRFVGDLKPRIFIMENVPGIVELREALKREFKRVGYERIFFNILKAEDYGNPSERTRVFVSNIKLSPRKLKKRCTVIDAIGDLPEPDSIHDIPNHEPVPLSPRRRRKIATLKWGEALIYFRGARNKVYTNYIRLHPFKLAPTVMGSSRFVHPFRNRLLTVREQARLMGFPDNHIFLGGRDVQFNQVGEAVPVPLARVIAKEVKKVLRMY